MFKNTQIFVLFMDYDRMKLISGTGNEPLARSIAEKLGTKLVDRECSRFPNGEVKIKPKECVRDCDVYLIQSTTSPFVNSHLMELWLLARTLKESDAQKITAILPFIGYTRQDKKKHGREPLSMKFVADVCKISCIDRYVFVDLHNSTMESCFAPAPTTNITPQYILADFLAQRKDIKEYTVAAADSGGVFKMREVADILQLPTAYVDKARDEKLEVKAKCVVGDVKDKTVLVVEDMIDTGGTIVEGVSAIKNAGAAKAIVYATHAVLSPPAIDRINASGIDELILTDTIPMSAEKRARITKNTTVLSWADILGKKVIYTLYAGKSITTALDSLLPEKKN